MVRRARPTSAYGASVRAARVADLHELAESAPLDGSALRQSANRIAAGAPVLLDSATLHRCLWRMGDDAGARQFRYAADRDGRRRFLLDSDNNLTEVTDEVWLNDTEEN